MRTPSAPQHWTWQGSGRNHNNAVPIAFLHTNHQVLYRNVYSNTYVGHMQTNKPTTLWQSQVPRSCVCNRNTNYFNSNCKQTNDSQKICAGGSVPSQPTRTQFLSLEMPATGMPGRTQQTQLKPCAKTSDWPPPSVLPHRPRGRCRQQTAVRDAKALCRFLDGHYLFRSDGLRGDSHG